MASPEEIADQAIFNQLQPRCITQSWIYEPDVGDYFYKINWSYPHHYTLERKRKDWFSDDQPVDSGGSWDAHALWVEIWVEENDMVELDRPQFAPSNYERTPVVFDSSAKARVVIKDDIKKQLSNR